MIDLTRYREAAYRLQPDILNKLLGIVDCKNTPENIYTQVRRQVTKSKQSLFDLHMALESSSPAIMASRSIAESEGFTYDPDCPNFVSYQGRKICDVEEIDRLDQLAWPGSK